MKRYLFLWVPINGYLKSLSEDETIVYASSDLFPQYLINNREVLAFRIDAPNKDVAYVLGCAKIFEKNCRYNETVSDVFLIDNVNVFDNERVKLITPNYSDY
jgi:hypothetical protein